MLLRGQNYGCGVSYAEEPPRRASLLPLVLAVVLAIVFVVAAAGGNDASPTPLSATEPTPTVTDAIAAPTLAPDLSGLADDDPSTVAVPTVGDATATTPPRTLDELPLDGPGTFTYAAGTGQELGTAPFIRYAVATEDGIGVDAEAVAALVEEILGDQRSWIGDGTTGFQRVPAGEQVLFTIVVAAPTTVDRLCLPLQTASRYSCGRNGWIALNLFRWETAAEVWPSTLEVYRQYLVNHEVGHYLLGSFHENVCYDPGAPAPIMMQQSIDLLGCAPNGWVYPN